MIDFDATIDRITNKTIEKADLGKLAAMLLNEADLSLETWEAFKAELSEENFAELAARFED